MLGLGGSVVAGGTGLVWLRWKKSPGKAANGQGSGLLQMTQCQEELT